MESKTNCSICEPDVIEGINSKVIVCDDEDVVDDDYDYEDYDNDDNVVTSTVPISSVKRTSYNGYRNHMVHDLVKSFCQ